MNHQFNIEIASKYGMDVAVFLENIAFWTHKNIGNGKNYKEGRYWVFNSLESWTILFPYLSIQNIRTIIDKCLKNNLLIKNNSFNKRRSDVTFWYSLSEKGIDLFPFIKSLLEKTKNPDKKEEEKVIHNHLLESTNGMLESTNAFVGINTALPDNKPDTKQHIKSFYASQDKKQANSKKHDFAQMMNEQKHIKEHQERKSQEERISPEARVHYDELMKKCRRFAS